jgi:hypothetical protein
MSALIVMLVVAVAYLYVVVPIQVRGKYWYSAEPVFEAVAGNDARVPAEIRAFWRELTPELAALGFCPTGFLINADSVPNVTSYLALLVNPGTGDEAAAYAIGLQGTGGVRAYTVEFSTDLTDGRSVLTNNSDQLPGVFAPPWRTVGRLPGMRDLGLLYRVHQALTEKQGGQKKVRPAGQNVVAHVREGMRREQEWWIEAGYYVRDEALRRLRLTWKGGYLSTWSQLLPIKNIRQWLLATFAWRNGWQARCLSYCWLVSAWHCPWWSACTARLR